MTETSVPAEHAATRRAVLGCAGAACAAVLAGCSTYNSSNGGVDSGGSSAPPASSDSGSGGSGSGNGGGGGNGGSGGAPALTTTAKVPVGGGTILADQKIVITQPKAGTFNAFTAVCTHLGCIVSTVSGGTINCPCHGSKFSITNGSVVTGPASSPLAPIGIKVKGKNIVRA